MPCAWDMGSARLFEAAGFTSIGTTSGGVNWSNGRRDYVYGVPKAEMLAAYSAIATATSLPVSGDLEHGYGETEADVADTIAQAIDGGMVGGSIEDRTSNGALFEPSIAAARIAAARRAADADLPGFVITARAESLYAEGVSDPMTDAIERCKRYVDAGADCIFVPGVAAPDQIERLVAATSAAVSLGIGSGGSAATIAQLGELGVRRVSTGGALPRFLYGQLDRALHQIHNGSFAFMETAITDTELERRIDPGPAS